MRLRPPPRFVRFEASAIDALAEQVAIKAHAVTSPLPRVSASILRRTIGLLAVADGLRRDARDVVAQLHSAGVEQVEMLSGDHEYVAAAVSASVGIDDYRLHIPGRPVANVDTYGLLALATCPRRVEGSARGV
jgi:cation transport ATPase